MEPSSTPNGEIFTVSAEDCQRLLASFSQASWEADPLGKIVNDSPSWRAYTGQNIGEFIGGGWINAISSDDRPHVMKSWDEAVTQGRSYSAEFRLQSRDGGENRTNMRATPVLAEDGSIQKWLAVFLPVEREAPQVEDDARRAEDKYQSIFNAIEDGFCIYELIYNDAGKPTDLKWIEVNPAYEKQTGLKDVAGKRHSELSLSTEDYWYETYDKVVKTGEMFHLEQWHQPTSRWYRTYTSRIGGEGSRQVAVVFSDITERRQREDQQRFLLKLNDTLRLVKDPVRIQHEALKLLAGELGAAGAYYFEILGDGETFELAARYETDATPMPDRMSISDWPSNQAADYRSGRTFIRSEDAAEAQSEGSRAMEVRVGVPLLRNGQLVALMTVNAAFPRNWTKIEIELLEEVAEHTCAAVERARAEEALRETKTRFQSVANLVPDLLWDSEPDGSTNWYNQRWLEYTGQTLQEAIGWGWVDAIHPDDREGSARRYGEAVETGQPLRQEHRIRRCDGVYRWFVVSALPVKDESGRVIKMYGAATDIHDRKESEEALRESEEKFRSLFQTIDEGFCIMELVLDPEGRVIDMIYREANDAFGQHTGLHQVNGKRAGELFPGIEKPWFDALTRVYHTGIAERTEGYNTDTRRWLTVQYSRFGGAGSPFIVAVFNNLTEQKQQEQYQAYMMRVSDALRPLSDPLDMEDVALALLRGELNIARATYAEPVDQQGTMRITAESLEHGLLPVKGAKIRSSDFAPEVLAEALQGHPLWRSDVQQDDHLTADQRAGHAALNTRAWLMVPVVKEGNLAALLTLYHAVPRIWMPEEITLARDTAERAWQAVERARSEQQVHDSEKRLRIATEAAEMATWEWDLVTNHVIWNERHFRIFGLEPHSGPVRPETFFEHIHPADREEVDRLLRESLANDTVFDTEFRAILEDGSERWMSGYGRVMERSDGQPISMSGVMFDVTDRRHAEQDLHRIQERQSAILDSATDYAIFTLDLDRRVRDWNSGAQRVLGYSEMEILGRSGDIFFVPEDRIKGAPQTEQEKAMYEGRAENERWHLRKDGSRFYGSGVTTPLLDETGNLIGLLKVMRDLTHQKRGEDALKQANKRKDEFLAMLAHELRNPISTVRNGISILKVMQQADSQLAEVVGMMDNQATHLVRMIDDLLDVSRVTQGKIELKPDRLEVSTLVTNAVKAIQPQYESRRKLLHMRMIPDGLFVQGDATRLTQVITNLLTNSLRYTGDDGEVWVSAEANNTEVLICIKDNGIGLTAEQQTSVFELFVQADNSLARKQGGLGVGLTLVRQLVQMHGGRVEARSPGLGQGSEFQVYLPLIDPPVPKKPSNVSGSDHPSSSQRILLIDDMEDLAKLTSMLLTLKGFRVDISTSGKDGIEAVERLRPSVVLCDIGMPGLDGYQTAQLIRKGEWGSQVNLIALSGYAQPEDKQKAKDAGFDSHLTKPVDINELQRVINTSAQQDH